VVDVIDSEGNLLIHREFSSRIDSQTYVDIFAEIISCAESYKPEELNSTDPSVLRLIEIKSKYFIIEKVCKS